MAYIRSWASFTQLDPGIVRAHVETETSVNWLAFGGSLLGMLCVALVWQAVDSWFSRRATRLQRLVGSGLLGLAIAIPSVWLLPSQSNGVLFGATAGLMIAGAIDVMRRERMKGRPA